MPLLATFAVALSAAAAPTPSTPICDAIPTVLSGAAASARNLKTIEGVYAAFGRGDVQAILGCMAEDVAWEAWADNSAQAAGVPWFAPRKGRDGVAAFFAYVGAWKVNTFAVKQLMAGGNGVAAE